MKNRLIYVASPYSHPDFAIMEARYRAAMRFVAWHLRMYPDWLAFSPIVYTHEMNKQFSLPTDAAWWERFNKVAIDNASHIYMLNIPGAEDSKGMKMEREYVLNAKRQTDLFEVDVRPGPGDAGLSYHIWNRAVGNS